MYNCIVVCLRVAMNYCAKSEILKEHIQMLVICLLCPLMDILFNPPGIQKVRRQVCEQCCPRAVLIQSRKHFIESSCWPSNYHILVIWESKSDVSIRRTFHLIADGFTWHHQGWHEITVSIGWVTVWRLTETHLADAAICTGDTLLLD